MLLKGRYEILEDLSPKTRLARQVRTQEKLVVKELVVAELSTWDNLQHFENEARALRSVQHRAVPELVDFFVLGEESPDPRFFLVQRFIAGQPLAAQLGTRLTDDELVSLSRELLEILVELHQLSPPLFHGNLEPSKIMRDKKGALVLIGFGLAGHPCCEEHNTGYHAPERESDPATVASELYSVGALLFHLTTGCEPDQLLYQDGAAALDNSLDQRMRRLLDRTLRIDPKERPTSAKAALDLLTASTALSIPRETALAAPRRRLPATATVAGLGALVELVCLIVSPAMALIMLAPLLGALYITHRVEDRNQRKQRPTELDDDQSPL